MLVFSHLLSSLDCGRRRASEIHWPLMAAGSGHLGMNKTSKSTNCDWRQNSDALATPGCWLRAYGHEQNINVNQLRLNMSFSISQSIVIEKKKKKMKYYKHSICCIITVRQVKPAGMTSSKNTAKTIIISWNTVLTNNQITTSITKARANEMLSPSNWKQN